MRVVLLVPMALALLAGTEPRVAAQVYQHETPPPLVTAASSAWRLNGEPIFHAGQFYYPAGATVFFDGKVMVRTGVFEGVPLYADVTLEPYSVVYVPIGGALMQPYERKRDGALTGTVGSRTPSFPIDRDVEVSAASQTTGVITPPVDGLSVPQGPLDRDRYVMVPVPVGTVGRARDDAPRSDVFTPAGVVMLNGGAAAANIPSYGNTAARQQPPASTTASGVWIDFDGERWFSAGPAVHYDPARFDPVGADRGFPIYRERGSAGTRIFVTVVHDGPVAPFERR